MPSQYAFPGALLPLLRIYWYDGTSQGPTLQHITLVRDPMRLTNSNSTKSS